LENYGAKQQDQWNHLTHPETNVDMEGNSNSSQQFNKNLKPLTLVSSKPMVEKH
jgi:hypothetical protein